MDILEERLGGRLVLEEGVREHIASACGGDIRKAMNALELLASAARGENGALRITLEDAQTAAQKSAMRYDREGDSHFDIASALMKSLPGSDPDAGGPLSGPAAGGGGHGHRHPAAAVLGQRGCGAGLSPGGAHREGLCGQRPPAGPAGGAAASGGGGHPAGHLAQVQQQPIRPSPGRRRTCGPVGAGDIPRSSRTSTQTRRDRSGSRATATPTTIRATGVRQQYLPDNLKNRKYYQYGDNKTEQAARRYWEEIKK